MTGIIQNTPNIVWTFCFACNQRVTGDSIHTCSPQLKTLTDEEIEGIARANVDGHASMEQLKWFARAILRKAQEK